MPAEVDQMFSVREMPWHREGVVLDDYPQTFAEARKLAGLDWDPIAFPVIAEGTMTREQFRRRAQEILLKDVTTIEAAEEIVSLWDESFRPAGTVSRELPELTIHGVVPTAVSDDDDSPKWSRIARSDTGATLSYQKDSYHVIPNSAFGEIIDAVIGAEAGTVKLETGGCLAGGTKVWMLARLDEPMQIEAGGRKDESLTFPFLGMTSDHTGQAKCAVRLTTVRIICANTFSLAEAEGQRTGAVYSFSHRGDWRAHLEEAREALQFARNEAREYTEAMSELLGIRISPEQEQLWLREFIPSPSDGLISDRVARNIEEARATVLDFLSGPTVEGAEIRGTAYGLVQAAGEYLDHARRSNSWESKLNRNLLRIEPLKAKAAVLAREAAMA